jgi:hypothetical protein
MSRSIVASSCLILLVACGTPDVADVPTPLFVIGEGLDQAVDLDWSPDGTRIAYAQGVEGRSAIFVAAADGANPVRITHGVWDEDPYWSPDLDHLVGASEQRGRHGEAERFSGLEVKDQLKLGWRLNRQIGRFGALENAVDV